MVYVLGHINSEEPTLNALRIKLWCTFFMNLHFIIVEVQETNYDIFIKSILYFTKKQFILYNFYALLNAVISSHDS